jgi:CelD/BcsL family acetyltransferase involved in cellulose biosynthesis
MIDEISVARWMAYDDAHPAPTFFARPAWALAMAEVFPGLSPAPMRVQLGSRRFLIPTMRTTRMRVPLREHVAFPLGGYTCVLDESGGLAGPHETAAAIEQLGRHVDHLRLVLWPLGPAADVRATAQANYRTAAIDCSKGFDHVFASIRGVTRRMAGQAERRGVSCERTGIQDMDTYYAMLERASRAWPSGRPAISRDGLRAVLAHGGDDAQLWLVRAEGNVIGGGVILFGSQELFFWSAAMDRDYARFRPSNALNVALLRAACDRGLRWYNLGASDGLEGVERFKHDLGASDVDYAERRLCSAPFRLYERARRAFVREVTA